MGITDIIFSTSFLLTFTLIIMLFATLSTYITYRIMEYDHKIDSMMNLIQAMAEEMQYFRSRLGQNLESSSSVGETNTNMLSEINFNEKINVSDNESEHYDDFDDDIDDDTDDDTDDDSIDSNDSDNLIPNILNISTEDDVINKDMLLTEDIISNDDIKKVQVNNLNLVEISNMSETNLSEVNAENSLDLKFIAIDAPINLEDNAEYEINDFKKMNLNKLRNVVERKGLVVDANKLKKNELLKLLEDKDKLLNE